MSYETVYSPPSLAIYLVPLGGAFLHKTSRSSTNNGKWKGMEHHLTSPFNPSGSPYLFSDKPARLLIYPIRSTSLASHVQAPEIAKSRGYVGLITFVKGGMWDEDAGEMVLLRTYTKCEFSHRGGPSIGRIWRFEIFWSFFDRPRRQCRCEIPSWLHVRSAGNDMRAT